MNKIIQIGGMTCPHCTARAETAVSYTHLQLTLHSAGYNLNLALTSIAEDGSQLQLTADTLGHGTFLAGLIAANGAEYQGLAPQVQLCVYKIFNREGQSSQIQLAQAIRAAILDGADCINLSLSIPKDETICPELEEMLNQARAANIPLMCIRDSQQRIYTDS